jgi:20S proteasome alpha/beta subunit
VTVLVGILCSDGVVIASDSAATYGTGNAVQTIGQQTVTKIWELEKSVLYASTGSIGTAQLISSAIGNLWKSKQLLGNTVVTSVDAMAIIARNIVTTLESIHRSAATVASLIGPQAAGQSALSQSLVALPFKKKACLFQFDNSGAPEQATDDLPFISLGIGQPIADPFLAFLKRILWKDSKPTVAEGRFAAAWTVQHVIETIPGGVGPPIQLATLVAINETAVEFINPAEHLQQKDTVETALREQIRNFGTPPTAATPDPPTPKF